MPEPRQGKENIFRNQNELYKNKDGISKMKTPFYYKRH